ncbi:permease [Halobacteria archaeon AArc-m2/3/4]|uniref:Permease n=1 Tax=Natronoglomus mannanivorans TaxID=2979990 RepID=A0AAP3E2C0_9EURY|nr:permease [Halobacteria archaeon AArc-xg1-1]MCU4971307.1 permease [Halobacteria archaeon AArc-m2/3/4]
MAAEQPSEGYLFDLYRQYIGEPDGRTDVYLGFGLFLGGIGLAIAGLGLFLYSSTLEARSAEYFAWVRPAYALGMLSLPATMLGIVTLLPTERRVVYTSLAGALVTVAAVVGFVTIYPDWNFYESSDAAYGTVHVVATYAIGLASITAATGAALIAHYLELARSADAVEITYDEEEEEHYSDEEIRGDIDDAMEGVELSWGGVEKAEHKRLSFSDHEFEGAEINFEAKTTRSSGVDNQVAGLKGLKGGETKTTTSSSTVDDQTAKLKELREQKQKEAEASEQESRLTTVTGPIGRLKARVSGSGESDGLLQTVRNRVKRN